MQTLVKRKQAQHNSFEIWHVYLIWCVMIKAYSMLYTAYHIENYFELCQKF